MKLPAVSKRGIIMELLIRLRVPLWRIKLFKYSSGFDNTVYYF